MDTYISLRKAQKLYHLDDDKAARIIRIVENKEMTVLNWKIKRVDQYYVKILVTKISLEKWLGLF